MKHDTDKNVNFAVVTILVDILSGLIFFTWTQLTPLHRMNLAA